MTELGERAADDGRPIAIAGDGLLHPLPLLAIGVLLVNDQLLKGAFPGLLTGKLSDFAGLIFFPLFPQAVTEVGSSLVGRPWVASRRVLLVSIVLTGGLFSAIQLVPAAAETYSVGLGLLQWLVGFAPGLLTGSGAGSPGRVVLTPDRTDLIALPALLLAYRASTGRTRTYSPA